METLLDVAVEGGALPCVASAPSAVAEVVPSAAAASAAGKPPSIVEALIAKWPHCPRFARCELVAVPGDGDCLFASVARAAGLKNLERFRAAAVIYFRTHADSMMMDTIELSSLLDGYKVDGYHLWLRDLMSSSQAGVEMMTVMAALLQRQLVVLGPDGAGGVEFIYDIVYLPDNPVPMPEWENDGPNTDHIVLWKNGAHYDAVVSPDDKPFPVINFGLRQMVELVNAFWAKKKKDHFPPATTLIGKYNIGLDSVESARVMVCCVCCCGCNVGLW